MIKRVLASGLLLALFAPAGAKADFVIVNGGFEVPPVVGVAYRPAGATWTFTGNTGIVNGTAFGNPAPPQGVQAAFLQHVGGSGAGDTISQSVVATAGVYSLSFQVANRAGSGQSRFEVRLDGVGFEVNIAPTNTAFALFTTSFSIATSGTHILSFVATGTVADGPDTTAFIDDVKVSAVPEPTSFVMLGIGMIVSGGAFARKVRRNRN